MGDFIVHENATPLPTIHVVSDSVGLTAQAVARAAAAQFGVTNPIIEVLPKARTFEEIEAFIDEHSAFHRQRTGDGRILVFYTLVDAGLSRRLAEYAASRDDVVAVDLMTSAVGAIARMTGLAPSTTPGSVHVADQYYFRRIEAIEFTIAHDDGRNPQEIAQADIVLLGVSRSSKTPTSIYLSQQGYKVANIPLDPSTEPPKEIFDVERTRLFGLMTTAEVLVSIRQRRLGRAGGVASRYADPEFVYQDLEKARALMRKLGCIVIHTENRAVEETAQEILRYYERVHPPSADMMG
ncbi:MAG: Putative pyruvate, phosphate dikinase regulatory protein [Paraeggerthella hongkongensis]|uniref:pyruvate, water dikinase regulatory protein n=1 Tax=Paraeggerthella TaxID=651554 RepID=UPI000DF7A8D3|nr:MULTISPECIES: pyruvate, water dikinase regulatory protein [Paraeggerthella]MBU5404574.1 kinase/pyrophosphorylase [Paraeggerthella hongkongensis]MCD2432269.1 kinase/pyrophosphorylase [Paraeggerthella hominis]MDY3981828.1 pyruvate, water dikinase regulatory protein [Paraeggerthella sp.]RDB60059.1 kinase/pyrophosphorylase [Paraeggerthella hongkongensis]